MGEIQGMGSSRERVLRTEFIMSNAKERSNKIRDKRTTLKLKLVYGIRNWQEQV